MENENIWIEIGTALILEREVFNSDEDDDFSVLYCIKIEITVLNPKWKQLYGCLILPCEISPVSDKIGLQYE